jgi:hypothetical protein
MKITLKLYAEVKRAMYVKHKTARWYMFQSLVEVQAINAAFKELRKDYGEGKVPTQTYIERAREILKTLPARPPLGFYQPSQKGSTA